MNILQILASENYITVNKDLIKILNLEGAVVFGELASEYIYWDKAGELEDGYFYSTVENMQEKTSLSSYQQRQALKILEEKELIKVKLKGIPAKRYIKINEDQVVKILNIKMLKNLTTRSEKNKQQDVKKINTNKNINNKNIINNKNSIDNICVNVITKLNELNGTNYSTKSKSSIKFIKGRLDEGYTERDLMLVVEKMSYLWNQPENEKMKQYLRPSTLFRPTNFENYLNMPVKIERTTKNIHVDLVDFINEGRKVK